MRTAVRTAFPDWSARFEGSVSWLYLDILGFVTIAIGNLVDDTKTGTPPESALSLPLVHPDGRPAPREAIGAAWRKVKAHPQLARWGHRAAEAVTSLRLTPEGVRLVVLRKLDDVERQLRARFPEWEEWPAAAQLATLSMAWACGAAFRYPRLEAALKRRDWATAAKECHINEKGNPGVAPRNVANVALYLVAASNPDPDALDDLPPTMPEVVQPRNPDTASEGIADDAVATYKRDRDRGE